MVGLITKFFFKRKPNFLVHEALDLAKGFLMMYNLPMT